MRTQVPAWSKCQRANVPINVPMCQRVKGVPIFQLSVPTTQGVPIFDVTKVAKGVPFFSTFQLFFQNNYIFLYAKYIYT